MSKIMAVNAGSSSLKFQLLEMPEEKLICSGLVERIQPNCMSHYFFKMDGKVVLDREVPVPNHAVAVQLVLDGIKELNIVDSLDEISGVGHRIVQGGPYFSDSVIINEDVKNKIKELDEQLKEPVAEPIVEPVVAMSKLSALGEAFKR